MDTQILRSTFSSDYRQNSTGLISNLYFPVQNNQSVCSKTINNNKTKQKIKNNIK